MKPLFHSLTSVCVAIGSLLSIGAAPPAGRPADFASEVDCFIGTVSGSGNCFPGAQVPFGMMSLSPHTLDGGACGYNYNNSRMTGFGLLHCSGVGCGITCELPFYPCSGSLDQSPVGKREAYSSEYQHDHETAEPGYYAVTLPQWKINCELTATARSGLARFQFPKEAAAHVILNPTANNNGMWDGSLTINPDDRSLSGWVKSGGFCGNQKSNYRVYFYAQFDHPFQAHGIWQGQAKNDSQLLVEGKDWASFVTFDVAEGAPVSMRVALSFVSAENARLNLQQELPDWDFAKVRSAARADWNRSLGKIEITGGLPKDRSIFYTALYHSVMLPTLYEDVNGEYRGMDDEVHKVQPGHHFLATFSGWDTYRTQAQLWGLLYPDMASDFCTSLLAMARETKHEGGGGLPLWSLYNDETHIMIGYPAAPYIASAYAFGAKDFDVPALLHVMVDSGQNQRWCGQHEHVTWDQQPEYKKLGFVPGEVHDSVSKTVEYAVADCAIAQMCLSQGDQASAEYFLKRSQTVFKLLHPNRHFLQRRNKKGKWMEPFDPFKGDGFSEGNSAHYTFTIAHNLKHTLEIVGAEESERRLDELAQGIARGGDYHSKYYMAGNEPCFGIMPVYNWLGKPWKAQDRVRTILKECFLKQPNGIPGDDDSGAQSAWCVLMSLGLYPEIPGVGGVTVLSPLFPKAVLHLPNGKVVTLSAEGASREAKYIQSMKINGQPNSRLWLTVDQLQAGCELNYVLGTTPNEKWGTAQEDAPPSFQP